MASNIAQVMISNILNYQYNPAGIQRSALQALTDATNGEIEIVDPTNPFVFCLEAGAVMTAAFMIKNEANTRKQYPYSAQNQEDLYLHMSDKDYAGRFATPSKVRFSILLPKEELVSKMVTDVNTGIRKIIIPRNTYFTVVDTHFSIQYPIEIRQLSHGGLQVVYDAEIVSPLQTLETNLIDFEIRNNGTMDWIYFEFDTFQFSIISQTGAISQAVDFKTDIVIEDMFYYARVYQENSLGKWEELKTTHTDQIYDITTPTAVIKVSDKNISITIPQIYVTSGLITSNIRMDVYQTKGTLNLVLHEYPFSAFVATWESYDSTEYTEYIAPLKTFRTIIPYSDKVVSGGTNGLTFDELRKRVIQNAIGAPSIPITNVQIENTLEDLGYTVVKNIDNITNRVFLATRDMPPSNDPRLITAAAASIETVELSFKTALTTGTVIDNGLSITITPKTLYRSINGVIKMISTDEVNYILSLPVDKRSVAITNGNYLFTPFHYVLDGTNNTFDSRPYYLDTPEVIARSFIAENDTTLIQVSTGANGIVRTETGYAIRITTSSADAYKALSDDSVYVQLAFIPFGEKDRAYINGVLVGKDHNNERIYQFDIVTNFNIDKDDLMFLSNFFLYTTEPRLVRANLVTEFDIIYSTSNTMGSQWRISSIDDVMGDFLLPSYTVGITHETVRCRLGHALGTLWARARTVVLAATYKKWETNVPRLYSNDVYEQDSDGSVITFDSDGNPKMTLLHAKGDPVLDDLGNPAYQYLIGDVMLDVNGEPVISDNRNVGRQIDMMLIEGAYWFATDQSAADYRETLTNTVVEQLTNDLIKITDRLLEQTRIYFYPKNTLGIINVMVENGVTKVIPAGQSFKVILYVSSSVYSNIDLRDKLTKSTIIVLSEALKLKNVSIDLMTAALRDNYGNDVISAQLTGLGGDLKLQTLTVLDDACRCSIRKRLTALADNSLIVEEDVTVSFVRHELTV